MRKIYFLLLAVFFAAIANAQVSVTATAGTTGPTPYTTLKDAFDAINAGTHQGVVSISLSGNTTETATASLDASGAGATSYTSVTVTATAPVTISGNIAGAIIKLTGADNVTIDGRIGGTGRNITVTNTSTTASSAGIWLTSTGAGAGATNNVIRNLEIACGIAQNTSSNSTFGIIMASNNVSIGTTQNSDDCDNNSFIANRIIKCRYGIVTRGTTTNLALNTIVSDNIIGPTSFGVDQIGKVGIFMQADQGAIISGNTVQFVGGDHPNTSSGADRVGIAIGVESWAMTPTTITSNTYTVTNNIIHDIIEERTFSAVGLLLSTTGGGSATNNLVANNFIYNVKSNGTAGDQTVGLGIGGGHTDRVVYNSIYLSGDVDPSVGSTATSMFGSGIRVALASSASHANLTLMNNAVYMDLSSSSTAAVRYYAISGTSAAYSFGTGGENHNDYYLNPANPQLQTGGLGTSSGNTLTTQFATLANWQTAYTVAQDANSIQLDPGFISATNLHVNTGSSALESKGTPIAGVTTDIDGDTRSASAPDIGADEYAGPCAGAVGGTASVTGPAVFCLSGTPVITATGYSEGTGSSYQWQSSNDNFVSNIVDIVGQTNPASLTTGVVSATTYYRLQVMCTSGTAVAYSNIILIEITSAPVITADPAGTALCAGSTATFNVTVAPPGPFTYQWQENTGSGFNNIPGATNPSLSFTALPTQNGYQYRVLVTNSCGTTTSGAATLTVSANPTATIAYGQTLYASDNAGNLYRINTTTGAATLVGNFDGTTIGSTEIEFDYNTGRAFAQGSGSNSNYEFNINTGAYIGPIVNTGAVHAGMEYVGSTLYATAFVAPLGPSSLRTLNPVTGVSTLVGATGIGTISGLAYDLSSGIMYGIAGGAGPAGLYTINLTTGAATLIGSTGIQAGSLQFGPDGRLYAGGTGSTFAGNIYVINTSTAAATLVGPTGVANGITGLTLANIPAAFCMNQGSVPVILNGSTGGTFTSSPAGLSVDPSTGAINTNTSTAGTYTVTYTIPAIGVCPMVVSSAPVTINPAPVIAPITGPSTVCAGQTITLSSATAGGTWSSTNTAAATVNPATGVVTGVAAGSTTIEYTASSGGCSGTVSAAVTVVAGPPPPVITPSAPVICAGSVQALTISSGASTVSFSGGSITLPAGAPGSTSGPGGPYPATIAVSGLPTSGVTVKSVTINGFTHTFPGDMDILLQSPTTTNVVLMSDVGGGTDATGQAYTFDDAAAGLMSFTALNPTGTYKPSNNGATDTYVAPGPGSITQANPALSAFTGNFNGTWNLFAVDDAGGDVGAITSWSITFDISPIIWSPTTGLFTNSAGTIPYTGTSASTVYASPATTTTYTASNTSGGCTSSSTVTVTVNPVPNVNAISNQELCHGASTAAISFTGTVPGTVYNWTNSAPSIGLAASGTGDIASFVATNTGAAPVVATITVTPTYTNAGTTCTGTARTFTITVNPILAITTQPVDRVVCEGVNTTFSVVVSGAPTYQWQINQGSGFVNLTNTAPYSGVTTNTLSITAPATSLSGSTFQVVITSPCGNTTSSVASLTVNPLPTISVGPNGLCAPVVLTATGTSNTYSWTPAFGLSSTTGPTVTASPTGNTIYTVTGTFTATGCQRSATVTVLGTPPAVVVTPAAPTICAGNIQQLTVPTGTATFNSSGTIDIPFGAPGTTSGPALPYPSAITVAGLPVAGVTVRSVTINGVTHTFPNDIDMLLQSPTGTNVVLMSDVGGTAAITGNNYIFSDTAANAMTTGANPPGYYKPTNSGATDTWVAPGPGAVTQATPLLSSFTGNPNGNWGLYIVDDVSGDVGSVTNWSITFNLPTATWTPVTGLFTDPAGTVPYTAGTILNTVYASPAATTTYTINSTLGTCNAPPGTVTVTVNPKPTITVTPNNQCGPVTLTAAGTSNTYAWTPAAGLSATTGATVTANPTVNTVYTVTGTITATGCTNSATVTVNARPPAPVVTPTSVAICAGAITQLTAASGNGTATGTSGALTLAIPDNNAAGINHVIPITAVPAGATITGVSVNFNITHTFDGDLRINLKAPNGNVLNLVNRRGGSGNDFTNTVISSAGVTPIASGTAPFTGTYLPDGTNAVGPTAFVSNVTAFSSLYGVPNGDWTIAINDNAGADIGTLTSWSIDITYTLPNAVWTPVTGLFTDPAATIPYVAGTALNTVYAKPATTTTYSVTRATATCTSTATTVTVTVVQPITVTTQPASQTLCTGANATFSIVATGNLLNYQWQLSTDGGATWNNIAGATNASLTVPSVTTTMSGNRYRVIVTNSCNTVTSSVAILTVNDPTPPTVSPLPARICISDTLVTLSGLPVGGSWSGVGVSGNNFVPSATAVGTYTLTYTYRNALGCTSSSTVVARVEDCPERTVRLTDNAVILYPNPNNGRFNIRINSTLYNYLGMRVYNAQGQLIKIHQFGGLVYGRVIPIDLTHLPGGTYMVKFYYDDGARSSDKTFKVLIAR